MDRRTADELLRFLRTPEKALPKYGHVHDQKTGVFVPYDSFGITDELQATTLDYLSQPERTKDGQTTWLTELASRQSGKSLTVEYGCYCKAAYTPGWDHVTIADTGDRALYLHRRTHELHERWDERCRTPTQATRESRQLTFDGTIGGKMRVLSAESGAVGLGQSPDSFHPSECAYWADFAGSMVLIYPSLINRDHGLVVFECTPWEAGCDWHDHCQDAKREMGRHRYRFFPMWDSRLNRRAWPKGAALDTEEERLLNTYGADGLTISNLAFRRLMLETDRELRRRPELFPVWYPFDDVTCWIGTATAAIPAHALARHIAKAKMMMAWRAPYTEWEAPIRGAKYVIGVDPSGYAARDHAAFHALRVTPGGGPTGEPDRSLPWVQAATFADHIDPLAFTHELVRAAVRYNMAEIFVESNGVGQGCLGILDNLGYPNVYYEAKKKPGLTTTPGSGPRSLEALTTNLVDALLDLLCLRDPDTVAQLQSYKHDKRVEESVNTEIVRGQPSKRRRERHHWDKVSALMLAVAGARRYPRVETIDLRSTEDDAPAPGAVHSGMYTQKGQAARWAEMQAERRSRDSADPWYSNRGRFGSGSV